MLVTFGRYAWTLAPAIGFYDGVFGPGAGSFYMIALVVPVGLTIIPGMAGGALKQFRQQLRRPRSSMRCPGHIDVTAGLTMGVGAFLGARFGARTALKAGAWLVLRAHRRRQLRDGSGPPTVGARRAARIHV